MDTRKSIYQHKILKDIVASMKNGNSFNLAGLLELLNTSTAIDVQVQIFSLLSAYLFLNDANIEEIVTYNPVYDKLCGIITNSPPRKTTIAFNFLSALLYVDDEDSHRKESLVAYAKNMIRSSGCLATMCELFTTCMMYQDTWRALCRCLAESCRSMEANQSYCKHLVPICIQKCSQRNIEVLMVLQSLLQHHNRNIDLFIECNGISLFQREFLQHDICLQLLATIAQSSSEAVALIVKTNICQQLRHFLELYGPQSQLGQWATIVLYHTSRVEVCQNSKNYEEKPANNELSESLLSKLRPNNQNNVESSANTTKFFQNIMKEMIQCGAQKEFNNLKAFFPTDIMMNTMQINTVNIPRPGQPFRDSSQIIKASITSQNRNKFYLKNMNTTITQNKSSQFKKMNELSFSFLRKQHLNDVHATAKYATVDKLPESFHRTMQTNNDKRRKNNYSMYESTVENNESCFNTIVTNDFAPKFASTPKKHFGLDESSHYEKQCSNDNTARSVQKSLRHYQIKRRVQKKKIAKQLERSNIDKEIKHRSFSGRFFDAINTSCTTLVKTVKNIFRPKNDLHETKDDSPEKTPNQDTQSCSYSFTNYMRKRDAILKNDCTNMSGHPLVDLKLEENVEDFSMEMSNTCNTCNDTVALKRKLANDEHLKQTIRKLKLGINLYGCDFKKISRTMWRKESYMTPAVLYNLYRKLIIK